MYVTGSMIGMGVGIAIGLIICIFVFKYMNTDKKMGTKYDEMQEIARGRGYKYSFWTLLICFALFFIFDSDKLDLPFTRPVLYFLAIMIAILVQTTYCIWHDAYIGINTNVKRFVIVAVVVTAINLLAAVAAVKGGTMFTDGKLQTPFINFLCALLFGILGVEVLIKHAYDKKNPED